MLDEMPRDRLVCGINNPGMQRLLLAESDLTLENALTITQGMEAAETSSKVIQDGDTKPVVPVHNVSTASSCYRCGGQHQPQQCRFKQVLCNYCKKKGHIAKVCLS